MSKTHLKKDGVVVNNYIMPDGEVNTTVSTHTYNVVVGKQRFVLLYEKFLSAISNVGHTDIKVFHALCFRVDKNNSFISNNMIVDDVAKEMKLSPNTVRNSITALKKAGFLHQNTVYKRNYIVNPEFMWQGDINNRKNVFKLILTQKLKDGDMQVVLADNVVSKISKGSFTDDEIERLIKDE